MNTNKILLRIENLTLSYGNVPVVENLSFDVCAGDYLCIVGENGSGKSTLLKALTGNRRPDSGTIRREGVRYMGYLPQQSEIQRDFPASVWEVAVSGCLERERNEKHPFRPGFGYSAAGKKRAAEALEMLDIAHLAKKPYNTLSGGQQQRVLLARALCASEELILLDEPVTGLDPGATKELYAIIRRLHRSGTAILMVTHDIEAALTESHHILCLCQRHPEKQNAAAPFYGTSAEYKASLSGDGCSCCTPAKPNTANPKILPPTL
ncbi:MAG: ABC transporter ATP-binding protein [Ruminococcaceae bacterium]|nr:ABC transporter ATP-binding protein [Oscillospiraceae bacterium]